jgi:hypothetical protein
VIAGLAALVLGLGTGVGLVVAKASFESDALIFVTHPNTLNGQVTSAKSRCMPRREVTVKKQRPGSDRRVSKRTTRRGGYWQAALRRNLEVGDAYYAAIAKRRIPAGLCEATHSNTTTVGG